MKRICTILAAVLPVVFSVCAAKTFQWRITGHDTEAARFAAYQGETVSFDFKFSGAASNCTVESAKIYYQTNGMDGAWWQTDGIVFAPSNDCGAASYRFFVRASDELGANYTANGVLRMLPSPGFEPSVLTPPVRTLDFASLAVANAPYYTKAETDAAIAAGGGGGSSESARELSVEADPFYESPASRIYWDPIDEWWFVEVEGWCAYIATGESIADLWDALEEDERLYYDLSNRTTAMSQEVARVSRQMDFSTNNTALVETITATAGNKASGLSLTDANNVQWTLGVGTNGCIFTYIEEARP